MGSPRDIVAHRGDIGADAAPTLCRLEELCRLVQTESEPLYVRYSRGPEVDRHATSLDHESGLALPGLSVNPLGPEAWWTRPLEDWLARTLCNYAHLAEGAEDRHAWVLTGEVVGRGPDNEPLVRLDRVVAHLATDLVDEAHDVYERRFDVGRDSRD